MDRRGEGFKLTTAQAAQLLSEREDYARVIFPFIGGNEINSDAFHNPSCWVVNFWDWDEARAEAFASAFSILESKVKPERRRLKPNGEFQLRKPLPYRWWQHGDKRPALYHALGRGDDFVAHPTHWTPRQPLARVLAVSRGVTKYPAFTFLQNRFIFSEKLYVITADSHSIFAVLSSDLHIVWAWMQKTSMANNLSSLSYTHGDIFETFAFPEGTLTGQLETLERVGEKFFQLRQEYMESHKQGLTRFYNDFHNPEKTNDALQHLRCAQGAVNRAVAEAYGWNDLDLSCDFQQVAYLPTGSNMRFTILERTRLDVLNRLSQLNASRHAVQCLATQDDDKIEDVAPFELKMVDDSAPSARGKRRRG